MTLGAVMLPERLDDYIQMLNDRQPFAFMGFGDGEWSWILGREITNCDGFPWSLDLTKVLQRTILEPLQGNAYYGSNPGRRLSHDVGMWLHNHQVRHVDGRERFKDYHRQEQQTYINWVDKETFANANCQGRLQPLFQILNDRRTMLVGPEHFSQFNRAFWHNPPTHVRLDLPADFNCRESTLDMVAEDIREYGPEIVTFSAGPVSNFLIHRLWPECMANGITLIDMGACFDPYCGVLSRKGYRKESNLKKMLNNYPKGK